jgi:hypothetical protein
MASTETRKEGYSASGVSSLTMSAHIYWLLAWRDCGFWKSHPTSDMAQARSARLILQPKHRKTPTVASFARLAELVGTRFELLLQSASLRLEFLYQCRLRCTR